jgi:hypothetical protein
VSLEASEAESSLLPGVSAKQSMLSELSSETGLRGSIIVQ